MIAPHVLLRTERLSLRAFTEADVENLFELNSDPEVLRYLAKQPSTREEIEQDILPNYLWFHRTYEHYGYWATIERATGAFVGWFHFLRMKDRKSHFREGLHHEDDIELGYRLKKPFWGKGYATEGASALVAAGFSQWEVSKVVASAMVANVASIRVLEKIGMQRTEQYFEPKFRTEVVCYALTRDEFRQGQ